MAIKAALAASLLVALLSLAAATTITTVTTTDDETNTRGSRQCSQQVQGRQFRACQRYLQQGRSSRPYLGQEEEEEEFGPENPQQQYLQDCCQQLREMDRQQCGCEAIRHAVRQAQQGGRSYQTGQSEQIYDKARQLPRRCNLSQQQCRFNVVFV